MKFFAGEIGRQLDIGPAFFVVGNSVLICKKQNRIGVIKGDAQLIQSDPGPKIAMKVSYNTRFLY